MTYVSAKALTRHPVLSEAETESLLRCMHGGDNSAQEQLLKGHSRLVYSMVSRYLHTGHDPEDLFQIGCIGLLKAFERFDLSYGVRFSTYAVPLILGEIRRFLRDDGPIKISRAVRELAIRARRVSASLSSDLGRDPSVKEVAAALQVSEDELVMSLDAVKPLTSLQEKTSQDDDSSSFVLDRIVQEENPAERLVEGVALKQLMSSLPEREQRIIKARYFENKTQTQVAEELGISQVHISRLEKRILMSLRNALLDSY